MVPLNQNSPPAAYAAERKPCLAWRGGQALEPAHLCQEARGSKALHTQTGPVCLARLAMSARIVQGREEQ